MQINTTVDGHVHTKYCKHATGEMEEYVQVAVAQGLAGIIFLEHLEAGIRYFESTWLSEAEFALYFQEGQRLRKKYAGQISVGLGVEVGYNPERVADIAAFLARHAWDRVGLSCHFLETDGEHLNLVSRRKRNWQPLGEMGMEQVVAVYFQRLRLAVEELPGTVVCHLDAVLRHHPDIRFSDENRQLALAVLDAMATRNMALEVNTSGFLHRGEPYPDRFFIDEAVRRGIKLVPGSDAHQPSDVGRYFDRLAAWT